MLSHQRCVFFKVLLIISIFVPDISTMSSTFFQVYYGAYNTSLTSKETMEVVYRLVSQSPSLVTVNAIQNKLLSGDVASDLDARKIRSFLGNLLMGHRIQRVWSTLTPITNNPYETHNSKLVSYVYELRKVEFLLRQIIMNILYKKIAMGGISECMDSDATNDTLTDGENLSWSKNHTFVGKKLIRGRDIYVVNHFTPSVTDIANDESSPQVSMTVESIVKGRPVRRRGRLKCVHETSGDSIDLTESQAFAGIEAFKAQHILTSVDESSRLNSEGSDLVARVGLKVVLSEEGFEGEDEVNGCTCVVAGVGREAGRVLLMFGEKSSKLSCISRNASSVWGTLKDRCSSILLDGMSSKLFIFWHGISKTADEAIDVLDALKNHQKAQPFLQAVDHVALGLTDYEKIVKQPMDLDTIEKKLAAGKYFRGFTSEIDLVKFRRDVDLIWNNAMAYNADGSWIYNYALTMKKFANRKMENAFKVSIFNMSALSEMSIMVSY